MKFEKIDDKIVIYMPGENKVFSEDEIKSLVLKIMDKLSELYKIELSNSYSVNFYRNEYYGIIIELIDDNIKFLDDIVNIDLNVSLDKLFLASFNVFSAFCPLSCVIYIFVISS